MRLIRFFFAVIGLLPMLSSAQQIVEFQNGQVADANDINANFSVLKERLDTLYEPVDSRLGQWHLAPLLVDCSTDPYAFQMAYEQSLNKDRLSFQLQGQCLYETALDVAGRFIAISGQSNEDQSCASPQPQLITQTTSSDRGTEIFINNLGALFLSCLVIGDSERAGGDAYVSAFANSLIRMDREVGSPTKALRVNVRNGSLFRYLGYIDGHGFDGSLTLNMGQSELVGSNHAIAGLQLSNSSIFNCRGCGGSIEGVSLTGQSALHVDAYLGDIVVSDVAIEAESNVYTQNGEATTVSVFNISSLEPADNGRRVYGAEDAGTVPESQCTVESQKTFVGAVAQDWYYWYNELADINPDNYASAQSYLDALMAPVTTDGTGRDPGFSYLTTVAEDEARFSSGTYYGFGFRYALVNEAPDFYFSDVFEEGPAYIAGLRRSQKLLAIDMGAGFESWDSIYARDADSLEVFGPSDSPVSRVFRVDDGGVVRDIAVTKAQLSTPPLAGEPLLIDREGQTPVGYINFRSFIASADQPWRDAAGLFGEAGVTDLVVDLRYNGGGLLSVARTLLNLLGGDVANGEPSYIVNFNDKRQDYNQTAIFQPEQQTFTPQRIAFITRRGTASASEMLINSLDPHIEVVMVGEDTFGKAVGQYAFDQTGEACDTRMRLITFETQNGLGEGGYYTGLAATGRIPLISASDGVQFPFGNVNEDSLSTALAWFRGEATAVQKLPLKVPPRVAGFDASWPMSEPVPLNPDGSNRSF